MKEIFAPALILMGLALIIMILIVVAMYRQKMLGSSLAIIGGLVALAALVSTDCPCPDFRETDLYFLWICVIGGALTCLAGLGINFFEQKELRRLERLHANHRQIAHSHGHR